MKTWSEGYTDAGDYPTAYHSDHTPARLALAALKAGIDAPGLGGEPVALCELGCGQGVTAALVAAANPGLSVHANDFDPAHVLHARRLAAEAGVANARFSDASFAEYVDDPALPERFDAIVLHGIYSWVAPAVRADVRAFLRRKLRPGGLVYVSYNALPGWAAAVPLQRLLRAADPGEGTPAERVGQALAIAESLRATGAGYFADNPPAAAQLNRLKEQDPTYVLHDFMCPAWAALSFSEVAGAMEEAKLTFAGSCDLSRPTTDAGFDEREAAALEGARSLEGREVLRDLLVNEHFRLDLFARGRPRLERDELERRWRAFRFAATWPLAEAPSSFQTHRAAVPLDPELYGAVLEALAPGPVALGEIEASGRLAPFGREAVRRAVLLLVHSRHVVPCLTIGDEAAARRGAQGFNLAAGRRAATPRALPLASPITGGGVILGQNHTLFYAARTAGHADPVGFALEAFAAEGVAILGEAGPLADAAARAEVEARFERFERRCVPYLRSVGIL